MRQLKSISAEARIPSASPKKLMKAAVLAAPTHWEVHEVLIPEPGPGQVRIRVEGTGICASNLPAWEGKPWFTYPFAPGALGHEGWGTIDAVGPGVAGLKVGDRVAMLSFSAYAEYDVADSASVVRLPDAMAGRPFPGEAIACAMNIFRKSRIEKGDHVAVVGVGFLGALLVQLARRAGARVTALSRRESPLALARRMGAEQTIRMEDHWRVLEEAKRLTSGKGFDCVIECAGKQWPLDLASELVAESGRLVIAGYHQDGPRQVNLQLWNWKGLDIINAHERDNRRNREALFAACDAVACGHLKTEELYTHEFPLDRINEAFFCLSSRPEGFLKAVVRMPAGESEGRE